MVYERKIWEFFRSKGLNAFAVAGIMGNLYKESNLKPTNLQNTYEKKLGYTDEEYTRAVDNGTYTNFVHDKAGYGLAQWTYYSRKRALYEFCKKQGKSIGDITAQLYYLWKELQGYKNVMQVLKSATSVREASNIVLLEFEAPADQSERVQNERAEQGEIYYKKYKGTESAGNNMGYTNSGLVNCTVKSPNHSGRRKHAIDRITPHCVVGQLTAEGIGSCFPDGQGASCNYGIGKDGRVCLIVDEANRSWCSSSKANDQRAVTIECASGMSEPYTMNNAVYDKLIKLCVDICRRNGKKKLLWFGDKNKTLNYEPKEDEMILTVHRWFANKSCPGNWLYSRMGDLANKVTAELGGNSTGESNGQKPGKVKYRVRKTWEDTKSQKGAFVNLENAKRCADKYKLTVYDEYGKAVYSSNGAAGDNGDSFKVRVTVPDLRIRKGAGIDNPYWKGKYTGEGVFTIVETKTGKGSTKGWGLLKSYEKERNGWISLDFCEVV